MIELIGALVTLFIALFWIAVVLTGAGIILALIVLPLAWITSLFVSPPD